jgi:hypothetical protein
MEGNARKNAPETCILEADGAEDKLILVIGEDFKSFMKKSQEKKEEIEVDGKDDTKTTTGKNRKAFVWNKLPVHVQGLLVQISEFQGLHHVLTFYYSYLCQYCSQSSPLTVSSGWFHYVDYNAERPQVIEVMADLFYPTEKSIGQRDIDREVLGFYLLYHYIRLQHPEEFVYLTGMNLRKVKEILGFSVCVKLGHMRPWRVITDGVTSKEMCIILGSVCRGALQEQQKDKGATCMGVEVCSFVSNHFVCRSFS